MKHFRVVLMLALFATMSWVGEAAAQDAHPTATRALQLSAFGAVSGVFTGLQGGKNFSITAGGDLGLPPMHGMRPTVELRGTYPTDHGLVDSQKSILVGPKVEFLLGHRLRPYGDFLVGRGQMNYGLGYIYGNNVYDLTTTFVYSPGAGVDFNFNDQLAVRLDGQFQRWGSTPTPSGNIYSTVGTVGIVYRFNFEGRGGR
jgi:opacity protein-like surface antigen